MGRKKVIEGSEWDGGGGLFLFVFLSCGLSVCCFFFFV
jgi:hypothetical protein